MNRADHKHFSAPLLEWFDCHGRKDLPWQHPRSAYRVWISEIMLQQTQVKTVIPYFNRFMESFPELADLALATDDQVLAHWSGLGYYSRARNLHKTAKIIYEQYQGEIPPDCIILTTFPGIGPSTAAAITSQAFNQQTAIMDGNVKRVLCRYFLIGGWPEQSLIKKRLWQLAQECMPAQRCADYTQAIMDLGATCCTSKNPSCNHCPLQKTCLAKQEQRTSDYPFKKQKKSLPVKQEQFLLLYTKDNEIYLEKRPPIGLWGGLWCLPAIESQQCPNRYIEKTYALSSLKAEELLNLKHSFSHFHLHIKAIAIHATNKQHRLEESTGRWFKPSEVSGLGLAKPVSEIINHFLVYKC